MRPPLLRTSDGVIAGVCAALAARFGLPKFLLRLGFIVFGLVGVGELVSIALWLIIPPAA